MNNITLLWYSIYLIFITFNYLYDVNALTSDGSAHNKNSDGYKLFERAGPLAELASQNDNFLNHEPHIRHQHNHHHQHSQHQGHHQSDHDSKAPSMWTILGQNVKNENTIEENETENQHIHQKKTATNCPKCQSRPEVYMSEEELKKLRIEYVKNQILRKLRLTERPNVSASNIPRPVAEGATINVDGEDEFQQRRSDDYFAKTTQKIIFPHLDNGQCKDVELTGSSMCFSVEIPNDIEYLDVESAQLWVLKQPHLLNGERHSLMFSEIEKYHNKVITRPFAIHQTNVTEKWVKIDITTHIKEWIKYGSFHHIIDISCNTCEKDPSLDLFSLDNDFRPFIVVNTHPNYNAKRQRRSINCSAGVTECCRDKLYISFAEIGWDDWILHPAGYHAYFCRGSCASAATITLSGSHYNSVLRKYIYQRNNSRNSDGKTLELTPCCTATQFSSLQLFYMDSNNTATQKTLPSMVVEACGCM